MFSLDWQRGMIRMVLSMRFCLYHPCGLIRAFLHQHCPSRCGEYQYLCRVPMVTTCKYISSQPPF